MSLGSLARWSSVLFGVVQVANTASDVEVPMSVVITAIICLILLLQFEYTDGGVIAALAVLETPIKPQDLNPKTNTFDKDEKEKNSCMTQSDLDKVETGDARQSSSLKQQVFRGVMEFLGDGIVSLASFYVLSHLGYIEMTFQCAMCFIHYTVITAIGRIFANSAKPNVVTSQRSLARRHLQSQKGLWSMFIGLDISLVYVVLTVSFMTIATHIAAESSFPAYIVSKLSLGLLLTNLHTSWVHTIISKPTNKTRWQRIPGRREWLAVIPIASLDIVLPDCVYYLTKTLLVFVQGIMSTAANDRGYEEIASSLESLESAAVVIIPILSCSWTAILTNAIYIRVAASMLPGDDQPVIPFDRKSSVSNDSSYLSILDAISTLNLQTWHRYLCIVWEVAVYEYLWGSFSVIVIAVELHYLAPCAMMDMLFLFAQHL